MTSSRCQARSAPSTSASAAASSAHGICGLVMRERAARSGTFEYRRDAHAAGGADRDQAAARALFLEQLGERRDDARAGRGERVAEREARAVDVELRLIDAAQGLFLAE